MNKTLLGLLAGLVFALSMVPNVQATPILVNNGESILFNFDLTGGTPAPPFGQVEFTVDVSPFLFSPDLGITTYDELNGAGNIVNANGGATIDPTWTQQFYRPLDTAGVLDGLFSALVTVNDGGPVTISNVVATGYNSTGSSYGPIPGVLVSQAPEPSILALFGIGFAGMGFARRRMNRSA
jgi:hypothetical protein